MTQCGEGPFFLPVLSSFFFQLALASESKLCKWSGNEQPIGNHKDDTQITFLFPVYVIVVASFAPIGALKKLYAR